MDKHLITINRDDIKKLAHDRDYGASEKAIDLAYNILNKITECSDGAPIAYIDFIDLGTLVHSCVKEVGLYDKTMSSQYFRHPNQN